MKKTYLLLCTLFCFLAGCREALIESRDLEKAEILVGSWAFTPIPNQPNVGVFLSFKANGEVTLTNSLNQADIFTCDYTYSVDGKTLILVLIPNQADPCECNLEGDCVIPYLIRELRTDSFVLICDACQVYVQQAYHRTG